MKEKRREKKREGEREDERERDKDERKRIFFFKMFQNPQTRQLN